MLEDLLPVRATIVAGFALAGGYVLARAHLAALALNVRLYLAPGSAWRPVALHAVRLAAAGACMTAAARFGAPALVATLLGFTLGRARALGRWR